MNFPTTPCETDVIRQLRLMGVSMPDDELASMVRANCGWSSPSLISNFIYHCILWKMTNAKLKKEDPDLTDNELMELEQILHQGNKQAFLKELNKFRSRIKKSRGEIAINVKQFRSANQWEQYLAQINRSGQLDDYSENEIFTDFIVLSFSIEQASAHAAELRAAAAAQRQPKA